MYRLLIFVALVGCYSPTYSEGLLCAPGDEPCPPGQSCFSGTCYFSSRDGAPDDTVDAFVDAAPCTAGAGTFCLEPTPMLIGDLNGVWGPSENLLWVVGNQGVWSYRSGTWTKEAPTGPFRAVHGFNSGAVWVTGPNGSTWFWNGTIWQDQTNAAETTEIRAVVGVSAAEAFSAGIGRTWHYSSGMPLPWPQVVFPPGVDARCLTSRGPLNVYLGGGQGTVGSLYRFMSNAAGWSPLTVNPQPAKALEALWASPNAIYIAGADLTSGAVYRYVETTMVLDNEQPSPTRMLAIHGASDSDVWAVGAQGTVLRRILGTWTPVSGAGASALRGVAVFPTRVWVVGDNGRVFSFVR